MDFSILLSTSHYVAQSGFLVVSGKSILSLLDYVTYPRPSKSRLSLSNLKTTWKKVIVWGKQAELCSIYLKKGKEVFVDGVAQLREFTNKQGERKSFEEINARLIGFSNL